MNESRRDQAQQEAGVRRSFLLEAIRDTEGTIRATDTKASIALVVHGFIFAGVLGLTEGLGASMEHGSCLFRSLVVLSLAGALVCFIGSVVQLGRTVAPAPKGSMPNHEDASGRFFIRPARSHRWRGRASMPSLQAYYEELAARSVEDLDKELAAELVSVSGIRQRKVLLISTGLWCLAGEVAFVVALLTTVGISSLSGL